MSTASQALRKCVFSGYLQILASTMVCVHQWVLAVPFQTGCHCCMRNEATRPSASPSNANLLFLVYVPGRIPHLSTSPLVGHTHSMAALSDTPGRELPLASIVCYRTIACAVRIQCCNDL
ncbi:hypothetical protein EDC04DRAFT_2780905 [Pisolithus marmoratus]|nr:hypothetical protein EDC04DRAFT_2780905 [Pisolithus marmoratus]